MPRKPSNATSKRKKVEIKKIENEAAREVCFSKRKAGLFSKASELASLCGVEVFLLIFSPSGNPYTFGCPAVKPVVDRFLSAGPAPSGPAVGSDNPASQAWNRLIEDLSSRLDTTKKNTDVLLEHLQESVQDNEFARWLANPAGPSQEQIAELKLKLQEMKAHVLHQLRVMTRGPTLGGEASSSSPSLPHWAVRPPQVPSVGPGPVLALQAPTGDAGTSAQKPVLNFDLNQPAQPNNE